MLEDQKHDVYADDSTMSTVTEKDIRGAAGTMYAAGQDTVSLTHMAKLVESRF